MAQHDEATPKHAGHRTRRELIGTVPMAGLLYGLGRTSAASASASTLTTPPAHDSGDLVLQSGAAAQNDDDPLGVRRHFPIVDQVTYLNSAYIAPVPQQVVDAGIAFASSKSVDPIVLGDMLGETNAVRRKFARLVGADEPEIGVLYATSDGENVITRALDLQPGDNVVVDDLHYETTYSLYRHLEATRGIEMRVVRNSGGAATPEAFARLVDDRTRIVSVAWVSHQNGYCHDLKALADIAHDRGAFLYADAIQGMGMLELDVRETGIDFFASGTYKWLLAGYGVAPFYVRRELIDTITTDRHGSLDISRELPDHRYELHDDARKYGYATMAFGAVYQLSAALDLLLEVGVDRIEAHTVALAHRLHSGLTERGFTVLTPAANRSAIVAFEHGIDSARVERDLQDAGVVAGLRVGGTQIRVGIALFNSNRDIERLLDVADRWT